jgi:hypothetical protein
VLLIYVVVPWTVIVVLWRTHRWLGVAGFFAWVVMGVWVVPGVIHTFTRHL